MFAILGLGVSDPRENLAFMTVMALTVAFFSASQDIVIDAYRIEILTENEQGVGAASTQIGYRLGLLVSGAGAIALSAFLSWFWVYLIMATLVVVGIFAAVLAPEPDRPNPVTRDQGQKNGLGWMSTLKYTFWEPFLDLYYSY